MSKCAVTFDTPGAPLPASGGSGAISVKTERECQWTAQPDVGWLNITAGASGQGDGTVQFNATANADPVARSGGIMLNGLRAQLTQAAGECRYELAQPSTSLGQAGGTGHADVRASSALCTWTASSDSDWIAITSGASGKGSAPVLFNVLPTTGPPRAGTLTIAGLHFNVTQAEGCTYAIAPDTFVAGASGSSNVITVTAGTGCPWTATSDVSWITLTAATGTGNGTVGFTVAPTTGPSRTGTLTVAGQGVTVTQSPGCSFDVSPLAHSADASGGSRTVNVSTAAGCTWSASSNDAWLTLSSASSGSGPATLAFTVAATTGPARTGTLTIAGQTITVTQSPGCSFTVAPLSLNVDASGGTRTVNVTTAAGCPWTASTKDQWITITGGASSSGPGPVTFTAAATNGPSRSATITVAGQTVTVVQGQGCTFSISPDSQNVPSSGGSGSVSVTAGGGCNWQARNNVPWIRITSNPPSGSGNGSINFTVDATTGPARSGTMTIAGRTFTVNQGQGCAFSLSAASATVPAGGGTGAFDVRTADGCGWSAGSSDGWLTVTNGASGSGNGTVAYSAAANTGAQRSATITVNGQTFTVTQEGGCTYSIAPTSQNVGSGGDNVTVAVTAPQGCSWTASPPTVPWITISSGNSGSGNGPVQLAIAPNGDVQRQGTVTIAGQTFTVVQASGCAVSISPSGQTVPSGGGSGSFSVNTSGACAWSANPPTVPWIHITSAASGAGPGTVQFTVDPNTGGGRSGTITVSGQTFTVTQDGGCSPIVTPDTIAAPAAGASPTVSVSTSTDCSWSATSNALFISIASVSATSGNGTVQLTVQPNTGPARSGTATIALRTVTVNQDSGCSISLTPTSQSFSASGGSGTVAVSTSGGCTWSAVPNLPWIRITNGVTGSGGGNVEFTVDPNTDHDARTGTIAINDQAFTINQDHPERP